MKKIICIVLAFVFLSALCACSSGKTVEPVDEMKMIDDMLSDLSQRNFDKIASICVLRDGSNVKADDIESIYDCIVQSGADPSLGFTVTEHKKSVNISANAEASNTYDLIARCGEKSVVFEVTISKTSKGYFFTQIYTIGAVTESTSGASETE